MSLTLILKFWREILIAILIACFLLSVRSCQQIQQTLTDTRAQDKALADNAKRESEAKQKHDREEYDHAKETYEQQIRDLASDHTVASIRVCKQPSSRPVSAAPNASAGTIADKPADVPQEATTDIGPGIDALTKECDALAIRHANLVDWVMNTR